MKFGKSYYSDKRYYKRVKINISNNKVKNQHVKKAQTLLIGKHSIISTSRVVYLLLKRSQMAFARTISLINNR